MDVVFTTDVDDVHDDQTLETGKAGVSCLETVESQQMTLTTDVDYKLRNNNDVNVADLGQNRDKTNCTSNLRRRFAHNVLLLILP